MLLDREVFYSENNLIVRRSGFDDLVHLSQRMSEDNMEELWVAHHLTPRAAVEMALKTSVMALTIEHEGKPVGIFGIRAEKVLGNKAEVYFLVTVDFDKIGRIFLRHAKKFIEMFLEFYPYLDGMVYMKNTKSIFWMKYCGCKMDEPVAYGIEGKQFQHFWFEK